MNAVALLAVLLRLGVCQEQIVIPQTGGTNVHIVTCAVVEPADQPAAKGPEREG